MKQTLTGALLASALLVSPAFADITVDEAYVRAVPPGQTNSAAFMVLHNDGGESVSLTAAGSDVADSVELHSHSTHDGVMQMRRIEKVEIPAAGEHRLEPGADHVMLIGLKRALKEGDSVDLRLEFSDGQTLELVAPVKSVMATMDQGAHHHHGN